MKSLHHTMMVVLCLVSAASAADYFPLVVGNAWTYKFPEQTVGILKMVVMEMVEDGTDTVFRVEMADVFEDEEPGIDTIYMVSEGNDILYFDSLGAEKPFEKLFIHRPTEGHEWYSISGNPRKAVYYGSITTVAGTFTDCYAIEELDDTTEIYAPDIGLVAIMSEGVIFIELSSYSVTLASPARFPPKNFTGYQTLQKNGVHRGTCTMVNVLGRSVNRIMPAGYGNKDRSLSPGTYFMFGGSVKESPAGVLKRFVNLR